MNSVTVGDQAQYHMLRRYNSGINNILNSSLKELGSELTSDVSSHLSGNFSDLAAIERSIALNSSYGSALTAASSFYEGQSSAFEKVRSLAGTTGISLVDAATSVNAVERDRVLAEGAVSLNSIVNALNTQVGGKSIFAGSATQGMAFSSADDIINSLSADLTSATTSNDVISIATSWFSAGGNYDTLAYQGSFDPVGGFKIGDSEVSAPSLNGNDQGIRELLMYFSIISAVSSGSLSLIDAEVSNLMQVVGEGLLNLDRDLISTSAELGAIEKTLAESTVANEAEKYGFFEARDSLIGVDAAEAYVRLSEAEAQLQAFYSATARVSSLSLVDYI